MWSISIYTGNSPFNLHPAHDRPVLTKDDVTDIRAEFVADPFMLRCDNTWYMFFEVMNDESKLGELAFANSNDGLHWNYQQIVVKEPFHLSYPYVFAWQNDYYMIPETLGADALCLYKADEFPYRWSVAARLLEGQFADPSIFRFDDLWWIFACPRPYGHDILTLYFAAELTGPWNQHPKSPIRSGDKCRARPAGRVLNFDNQIIRFAQDCVPHYGTSVRPFAISQLTQTQYAETEMNHSPILTASGTGWNAAGMHHIDAHELSSGNWLACVDGLAI